MSTISEAMSVAYQQHEAGNLQQAEQIYRQVLQVDPNNFNAIHLLGLIALQVGRTDSAVDYISQALRLMPDFAAAHYNLGLALRQQGKLAEAMAHWRQAVRYQPDYAEAHYHLGNALQQQGKLSEAIASWRQAVRFNPHHVDAHNNLGNALQQQGQLAEAEACLQQALQLKPDFINAHQNLGNTLLAQGKLEEAIARYQHVLRYSPNSLVAYNNLGKAFLDQHRLDEAAASLQQALRVSPDFAEAYNNLGLILQEQGKTQEAIASLQRAVRLNPNYVAAHINLALSWLVMGNFEQGWPEYEWRWKSEGYSAPNLRQPLWDGTALKGRTILLHAEQHFGDTFQFIRYAELVKQYGGRVCVVCPGALMQVLANCAGIDQLIAEGNPLPYFDVHAPFLSLPRILGTTLDTIPAKVPYLTAQVDLIERWRDRLSSLNGPKIGICWQGTTTLRTARLKALPLKNFAPLAQSGAQLISLQKDVATEQLEQAGFAVNQLAALDEAGAFLDTAAVMMNVDLIISCDTSVAHLAGALGVPVWVPLPFASDWRWLLHREDSPWYPTMRLYRQPEPGNWQAVFQRMAADLRTHF